MSRTPLADPGLALHEVPIPEWKGRIFCRPMRVAELAACVRSIGEDHAEDPRSKALLIRWCVCDPAGRLIFTDRDVAYLPGINEDVFHRMWLAACEMLDLTYQRTQAKANN